MEWPSEKKNATPNMREREREREFEFSLTLCLFIRFSQYVIFDDTETFERTSRKGKVKVDTVIV
jgi:hypothetical protein